MARRRILNTLAEYLPWDAQNSRRFSPTQPQANIFHPPSPPIALQSTPRNALALSVSLQNTKPRKHIAVDTVRGMSNRERSWRLCSASH